MHHEDNNWIGDSKGAEVMLHILENKRLREKN